MSLSRSRFRSKILDPISKIVGPKPTPLLVPWSLAGAIVEVGLEIEIGMAKSGRRAWGFDDIAIVPSRRTRDPDDVDLSWEIDAFTFDLPMMASAMDSAVSPSTAAEIGRLGGLAVLNLEGLWTRYEDPGPVFEEISAATDDEATRTIQKVYQEPIKRELIGRRVEQIKASGVLAAASLTPQNVETYHAPALEAGLDVLVIQGTVVSAEHVSTRSEPLDLFHFIASSDVPVVVGGVASYSGALHLMRTGAVGVLVGVGPGAACTSRAVLGIGVPQATAIADAAGARIRYLEETGRYVHVIADGGNADGRRHCQGDRLRRRRGHARVAHHRGRRGTRSGSPLGNGYLPPDIAARHTREDRATWFVERDSGRTRR